MTVLRCVFCGGSAHPAMCGMWEHDCGCIEVASPYRRYPCKEHRPTRREAVDALVAVLVLGGTFCLILVLILWWLT